jgi:hypothetical protein
MQCRWQTIADRLKRYIDKHDWHRFRFGSIATFEASISASFSKFKMRTSTSLATAFVLTASLTQAFIVNGWLGQECNGEPLFTRTLGVQDGCVTTGAGQAESVTVTVQDTDKPGDRELILPSGSCLSTYILLTLLVP